MKHHRTIKIRNEGSAWAFIYKVAGLFVLIPLMFLLAFKSWEMEKIDTFFNSMYGQFFTLGFLSCLLLVFVLYLLYKIITK